ncbi:hypothetical protein LXA43DRAFT_919612, partial [Ganoderma leucocontextum]
MWLKSYLDMGESRPLWAYVMDDLFRHAVAKNTSPKEPSLRVNPFLQHWQPSRRALPKEAQALLDTAKRHNVRPEGLAFERSILRALPMWDHFAADRSEVRKLAVATGTTDCLKFKHCAVTVGEFEELAAHSQNPEHREADRSHCQCEPCRDIRERTGCLHPYACYARAKRLLDTLPPKWDPRGQHPEDTENQECDATQSTEDHGSASVFDQSVTTRGDVGQIFRVFTDGLPTYEGRIEAAQVREDEECTIATAGACADSGESTAQAGGGLFVAPDHPLNCSLKIPASLPQNCTTGELAATIIAAKNIEP